MRPHRLWPLGRCRTGRRVPSVGGDPATADGPPYAIGAGDAMTSSLITHLVQSYGYYAVFAFIALESVGIPLPGETALISAALYAGTTHHLNSSYVGVSLEKGT